MVFSELPDMSDPSHEFAQQYQKPQVQVSLTLELSGLKVPTVSLGHNAFMVPCPVHPSFPTLLFIPASSSIFIGLLEIDCSSPLLEVGGKI